MRHRPASVATSGPPRRPRRSGLALGALVVLVASVVLAGCANSSEVVVRPPVSSPTTSTPTTSTPTTSTTTSLPSTSTTVVTHPRVVVTPSTGLADGQMVDVTGSGFSPGEAFVVIECADLGARTSSGDCNLEGLVSAVSDGGGRVVARLKAVRGPFGGDRVTCTVPPGCLVSVSQATPSPTEEASAPIRFR